MKVLIVAKTRRGNGACVGGITEKGESVRLTSRDANERAGLEYNIGEVWEIEWRRDPEVEPPHVENIIVLQARKLRSSSKLRETISRFMPPVAGGPEKLFDGLTQVTAGGCLYVADGTGIPRHSTMFWLPDRPLRLDCEGKRIRYRYPMPDGGRTVTFVGFQEPPEEIPANTLLRISLSHRWRPTDRSDEELRCFVQLSGWFPDDGRLFKPVSSPPTAQIASAQAVKATPASSVMQRALETMKRTFGFSTFLPLQQQVIDRVLHHQDSFLVMPTGAGKSLCYQLPALLFDGLTVVISPLIALMQDQVRQLTEMAVPAACLNHLVPLPEYISITKAARKGQLKLLYLAPETLMRPETLLLLEQGSLACLAIDEAHCISEWGHDFRPEYRQLKTVRARFPRVACLALTATATARVRADVRQQLGIPEEGEFVASFNRGNLFLAVEPRKDPLAQILAFLAKRRGQSGIIYCGKRKKADELCASLNANQWPALPYHAGLEPEERRQNQERFISDDVPLIVATIAFGMGINKPNVRFVIHAHLPKDIESYYQEIGRAGRDGLPADCLLLYSRGDAIFHHSFIDQGAASQRVGRQERLNAIMRLAEACECRRLPLLTYFDEQPAHSCGSCDNCRRKSEPVEKRDVTADARKFFLCVKLTGQMFGSAHVIAVLRGSRSKRVLSRGHDQLPCFGEGKDHSTAEWQVLNHQFVNLGLLKQDLQFGSLTLTAGALDVLSGNQKVLVPLDLAPADLKSPDKLPAHNSQIFAALRALRREIADELKLPAYCVFSDRSLIQMATVVPRNEAEFLAINGVGEAKLAKHGKRFLEAIQQLRTGQSTVDVPGI